MSNSNFPSRIFAFSKVWGALTALVGAAGALLGAGAVYATERDRAATDEEAIGYVAAHNVAPLTRDPKTSPHPEIATELQRLEGDYYSQLERERAIMAWIVGVLAADLEGNRSKKAAVAACAREQFRITAKAGDYSVSFDVAADMATKHRYNCK